MIKQMGKMLKGEFRWKLQDTLCTVFIFSILILGRKTDFVRDGQDSMMQNLILYWYFFMTNFIQKYQYIFWHVIWTERCMRARLCLSLHLLILGLHLHTITTTLLWASQILLYCFLLKHFTVLFGIYIALWTISPNLQLYWRLLPLTPFTKT